MDGVLVGAARLLAFKGVLRGRPETSFFPRQLQRLGASGEVLEHEEAPLAGLRETRNANYE